MRIFETNGKINFVDDNNVFVGFDYSQDCCEDFGYKLIDKDGDEIDEKQSDIHLLQFDSSFYEEDNDYKKYEYGGAGKFRRVDPTGVEIFLIIWNSHNGYYGHGFEMLEDGKEIRRGCL